MLAGRGLGTGLIDCRDAKAGDLDAIAHHGS
jgi:hypothetical protein